MLPSAAELTYFIEIAACGNLSRAAERLGVTQPALSQAVRKLEDEVGVPLLIRSKTGVRLTKSGERLQQQARQLLDDWARIRGEAVVLNEEARGHYSIGCHPSVALYSLPHVLPTLLGNHPGVEISLRHDLSRKITEGVVSCRIDFGIVVNPVEHQDLVIEPICFDTVGFWTAREDSSLQKISDRDCVLICDPELMQTQTLCANLSRQGIRVRRTVESSSLEVVAALTASGVGIGVLPRRVATRIKEFALRPAGEQLPTYEDRICLIYRADGVASKGSRIVARMIRDTMRRAHEACATLDR